MPRKFGIARIPADSIVPRCGKFVTNFPGKCASNRGCWSLHEYASKGASMRMRLIAVLAVLTAFSALGGCFHHNQAVIVEPQALPPLK